MSTRRAQRKKPLSLLGAILRAASQVRLHAVLDRLRIGDRHEAHADRRVSSVPMTISPSSRVQASKTGPAQAIVSVNDKVMEPGRRGVSMRGAPAAPRTGLLLSRSAHRTAGAASGDIADQRAHCPNGPNQFPSPPGGVPPALRADLTTGRHPLARRGTARPG
jgi:hypothetical protein